MLEYVLILQREASLAAFAMEVVAKCCMPLLTLDWTLFAYCPILCRRARYDDREERSHAQQAG